jgi:hypothetical protein
MQALQKLVRFARKSPREQLSVARATVFQQLIERGWKVPSLGKDRTTYVIGLFGSGRWYILDLMLKNIGERAKYFKDEIRFHPGPTSMVYSGHATMKYEGRGMALPVVASRIFEAVKSESADLIFVYRHPLDSLLTNWVFWRINNRDNSVISGISQVYKNTEELCTDLELNFPEFLAFAKGDPEFFAAQKGLRFLSLPEFVEETELYLQAATLALRLEDVMIDPLREFTKIVDLMSIDLDRSRLRLLPARSKPYGYLAVAEKVPRFRDFINGQDEETQRRIQRMGYEAGV